MAKKTSISEQLKTAIAASGKSVYGLAKESGIAHPVILRFIAGERDIRMASADKLAETLGLELKCR